MDWTELTFSKKQVRKAGEILARDLVDNDDPFSYIDAYLALSYWRACHAYPMQAMLSFFRKKALEIDNKAIIVQRLKRTPSIISKLTRESNMKLDRVEDIAGCRIVVESNKQVYEVMDKIKSSRSRNILHRERDYIATPKESGYRGIHLIYKYNGSKIKSKGLCVELQIRNKLQHAWATAVEVIGTFTKQSLKASQGKEDWLNFFKLSSIAFSDIESRKIKVNAESSARQELLKYIKDLHVLEMLSAFAVTTQHLEKTTSSSNGYFILLLDIELRRVNIKRYKQSQFNDATNEYVAIEKSNIENKNKDVVLISSSDIYSLRKAYPNYFADTTVFTDNIKKLLKVNVDDSV